MSLLVGCMCASSARADTNDAAPVAPAPPSAAGEVEACSSADDTTCGRLQFEAGTRAFERGDFERARMAFEVALARRPHPVIRYNLALCWARMGKPSAAIGELRLVLSNAQTDPDLRARSERELRLAVQAQAHISFTLSDPARERVELDGEALPSVGPELALDPGLHRVRISSETSVVLDQELDLSPGERVELRVGQRSRRIDVIVVPDPVVAPAAAGPVLGAKRPAPRAPDSVRRPVAPAWFFAAAGGTAVLAGLTVWSGLDTQKALTEYQKQLPGLTQLEADSRVGDGHSRERRTNLLLTGSLLAAAGSAVLAIWFVDFGGGTPARVALGPEQLTISTRF